MLHVQSRHGKPDRGDRKFVAWRHRVCKRVSFAPAFCPNLQEREEAQRVERLLLEKAAAITQWRLSDSTADVDTSGCGSYTGGILYDKDYVILTKQQLQNPHGVLKALNFGTLPYVGKQVSHQRAM
jgi:hypothetical protein